MKILANDGISQSGLKKLEEYGYEVSTTNVAQEELIEEINNKGYEVVLVRSATKIRKDIIDNCPKLRLIGRGGVGLDNIDVAYAKEKGIEVINTPAASSQSVAELVMAHLFSISRQLFDSNRQMPANGHDNFKVLKKKYAKGIELRGKTLGIIGLGRIGQAVAKYALGNGMTVVAHDPFVSSCSIEITIADQTVNVNINSVEKQTVLNQSDFITLHVPKPSNGDFVLGQGDFDQMKDGVIILNAARGGTIDEKALINALDNGKVAFSGLDVFENEPTPNTELLTHERISLSPHIGAATLEAQDRIGLELAEKINAFFN